MNLQTIAEHTVDMDLLPEVANILDAGCMGFEFTNYFRSLGHCVVPIDIQYFEGEDYHLVAITGDGRPVGSKISNDPQATCICDGIGITSMTLHEFCNAGKIYSFDLIKLDIEGSEYEVIMSMNRWYTRQLSVEFHTHCGQTEKQVQQCVDKLHSLGYKIIQHEKTARHGLKPNYWDSLFCL